jgi:hypothetical protein
MACGDPKYTTDYNSNYTNYSMIRPNTFNNIASAIRATGDIEVDGNIKIKDSITIKDDVTGWEYKITISDGQLKVTPVSKEAIIDSNINNIIE